MIVTIDGPAASGKSSIAREISERLGLYYLNTGLLYRALAYVLLKKLNKSVDDLKKLSLDNLNIDSIKYVYVNMQFYLKGLILQGIFLIVS